MPSVSWPLTKWVAIGLSWFDYVDDALVSVVHGKQVLHDVAKALQGRMSLNAGTNTERRLLHRSNCSATDLKRMGPGGSCDDWTLVSGSSSCRACAFSPSRIKPKRRLQAAAGCKGKCQGLLQHRCGCEMAKNKCSERGGLQLLASTGSYGLSPSHRISARANMVPAVLLELG